MGRLSLISVALILSILGSGCAKSEDKPLEDVVDDGGVLYTKASCEFKADEGSPAPSDLIQSKMVTAHFGKKFEFDLLSAVANVSATELVRFAKLTGVEFRTVSRYRSDSCELAQFIPNADSEMQNYFDNLSKNILGLYFSPKASQLKQKNDLAVILIRRDTNKWVMLHEYAHHLFAKVVQSEIQDDLLQSKSISALNRFDNLYELVVKKEQKQHITEMVEAAFEMSQFESERIRRYSLEEVAIEVELDRLFSSGKLKTTPINQSINGAGYIISSAEKAKSSMTYLINDLQIAIIYHGIYKASSKVSEEKINQMREKISLLQSWSDELDPLVRAAKQKMLAAGYRALGKNSLTQQGFVSTASGVNTGDDLHVGCSHGQDADKIINLLRKNRN